MKELLHDDDVRRDAIAEGRNEGIVLGRTEGIAVGKTEGIALGRTEERVNTIQRLLAKGFTMDVIQSLDYNDEEIREAQTAMITKL